MSHPAQDRLVRAGQLKAEPRDDAEILRMLTMARTRLLDAGLDSVSLEGRFTSSYNAAHAVALAALRWHGYRSESRYLVFQCLTHTLGSLAPRWRVLDAAHRKRNLAEY
jgi:collagenase-like PrtC family protease